MAKQQTTGFPGVHKGTDGEQRKWLPKKKGPCTGGGKAPGAGLNGKFGSVKGSGKP